ncbi:MAG: 3-keto-5-aminohexanoate cleavage protein, partial [Geminicoccaceae bacterium]
TLPMPANYYDDVQARFGLSEALTEQLCASNILYDEDAKGQYYQLYSRPYGDGFFFEIVHRANGYQGYGAANAPYRTAALKRSVQAMTAAA